MMVEGLQSRRKTVWVVYCRAGVERLLVGASAQVALVWAVSNDCFWGTMCQADCFCVKGTAIQRTHAHEIAPFLSTPARYTQAQNRRSRSFSQLYISPSTYALLVKLMASAFQYQHLFGIHLINICTPQKYLYTTIEKLCFVAVVM